MLLTVASFRNVDIYAAFASHINMGRKRANTNRGVWWSACPYCGCGQDRFCMWPYRTDSTIHFWCHVCGEMGDIVKFICDMEGMSFLEACEHLGVLLDDQPVTAHNRTYNPHDDDPPVEEWQQHAKAFAEECKANLLAAPKVLAWLRARGLTDEMIDRAGLGYNPTDRFIERKDWGIEHQDDPKKIWVPRGITIPWMIDGQLWAVKIRRSKSDMERDHKRGVKKPPKYVRVSGSSSGIYGIDRIIADPSKPTLIVEGVTLRKLSPGAG